MINIRQKTQAEIREEESLNRFGAAVIHGIPKSVCPTYLMKRDGTKVDTNDLTEEQILGLIQSDLMDYASPQGSYKRTGRTDLDSFKLAEDLKGHYTPSLRATYQMMQLEQQYGHIVVDLMGSMGALVHRDKAKVIAQFQKETSGDFTPVQQDEIMAVIEQMAINEQAKKSTSSMRR